MNIEWAGVDETPECGEALSVVELDETNYERWFRLSPELESADVLRQRVFEQVRRFAPSRLHKLVVLKGEDVVGRMNVLHERPAGVTFWQPAIHAQRAPATIRPIFDRLLHHVGSMLEETGACFAETKLCTTDPWSAEWSAALVESGFFPVAESIILKRDLGPAMALAHDEEVWAGTDFAPAILLALFLKCQEGSLDREGTSIHVAPAAKFSDLAATTPFAAWRIAVRGGVPVGMCIAGREKDEPGGSAWVFFVGVVPQARASGVGRALLLSSLARLADSGATEVSAFIDILNLPSLALHASLGFHALPARYATHQRS